MAIEGDKLPGVKQFELSDRVAIVTGGSRGLGLAIASALASAGAKVMLVNRNTADGIAAAKFISEEFGTKAVSYGADITSEKQTVAMARVALDVFARIDILVNCAGINIRGPIDELNFDDFRKVLAVNVDGSWLCAKAIVPHMKEKRSGKIINVASTLGLVGLANRTPYASSKGAVIQLTRSLALELAPFNINVNAICPGPFLTEMNIPIADTDESKTSIVGATALRRWGELKEIQGAAILLASDAANYMVGSLVTVDGGWTAR